MNVCGREKETLALKAFVEHYEKQETRHIEDHYVVPGTLASSEAVVRTKVNMNTKIRNVVEFAKKKIKNESVTQVLWIAIGRATSKAISCAEIFKRAVEPKVKLHQITKIRFKRTEEIWKPKIEGLDILKTNIDTPAIYILLSKEPLDETEPGYQPPGPYDVYWKGKVEEDRKRRQRYRTNRKTKSDSSESYKPEVPLVPKLRRRTFGSNRKDYGAGKEFKEKQNEEQRGSGNSQDNRDSVRKCEEAEASAVAESVEKEVEASVNTEEDMEIN